MPTVIINKFDGGVAEDLRTFATDESEVSRNFDIFTNPHKLIPYQDSVAEIVKNGLVSDMDDIQLSDVDVSLIGGTYFLTASGYESGSSTKPAFYTKAISGDSFSQQAVAASVGYVKGSGVVYKDLFFALNFTGGVYTLNRYNSAGSVTAIGTITTASTFKAKPFVHPQDNVLYIVIGTIIASWDGTTFNQVSTILPAGYECTSLTDYGTYLAIAMRPLRGSGVSRVYLWGRDMTLNTLQGTLDFGEGNLAILENLDNNLIAIMQLWPGKLTEYQTTTSYLIVKKYSGAQVETVRKFLIGVSDTVSTLKIKNQNRLYFGFPNDTECYEVGKNNEGNYILTKGRYFSNGSTITEFLGFSMIGVVMWMLGKVSTHYVLMRTRVDSTWANTSIYKTTKNPSMLITERGKNKRLKSIRVYYTGKASGTIGVRYLVDSMAITSVISETTNAGEGISQATMQADGQSFNDGKEIQFWLESTGGVEIKALEYEYDPLNQ